MIDKLTPTGRTENKVFQERYSESGHFIFSRTETDNRFALCRESLLYSKGIYLYLKGVYPSLLEIESFCVLSPDKFEMKRKYEDLSDLGYGGQFLKYEKGFCPEGALFPFLRGKGRKNIEIVDEGCIWLGTRFDYPLIFIENEVANWINPYSKTGRVRIDPFRPYAQVLDLLPKLVNKDKYPDLDLDLII